MERTLIIVKPDAVQRGLIGEIIRRFEVKGLRIIGMKFMQMSRELAAEHYAVHKDRDFYPDLVDYITSAPVVVMALEGPLAVENARAVIGNTRPHQAAPGSIRGDLGVVVDRNLVHGSDSVENGEKEVALFFQASELVHWARDVDRWVLGK